MIFFLIPLIKFTLEKNFLALYVVIGEAYVGSKSGNYEKERYL